MLPASLSLLFKNLLFLSPPQISFPLLPSHLLFECNQHPTGCENEKRPSADKLSCLETGPESGGPDCGSDFLWPFQAGFPTRSPLGLPLRSVSGEAWQLTMVLIQRTHNYFQMLFS